MASAALPLSAGRSARTVPVAWLAGGLLGLFALDNALLLAFLGFDDRIVALVAAVVGGLTARLAARRIDASLRISAATLAVCLGVAIIVLLLGGEGRAFYANPDWQVRDAVLADLASNPWPFAYRVEGADYLLRAPLGMYLLPALSGKAALDTALLASNAIRLGALLALGSVLLETRAQRWTALIVVLAFSGWDAFGVLLHAAAGVPEAWDHIEPWNAGLQYSSTLTVAFWAPNHGIAGWACAVTFLLWRRGFAPIGLFAATIPLVAFWSPLAVMGAVPFALYAGIDVLRRRDFGWADVAFAALAVAIALPSLAYERLDPASVPMHVRQIALVNWMGIAVEMMAIVAIPFRSRFFAREARGVMILIAACLVAMPAWQIGSSADFQMRASIMALTLLAVFWSEALARAGAARTGSRASAALLAGVLMVGAITPALEVKRALAEPAAPAPRCSLAGVWNRQSGLIVPYGTYLARLDRLPPMLRNAPVTAGLDDPRQCWDRAWPKPVPAR